MQAKWGQKAFAVNAAAVTSEYMAELSDWGAIPMRYKAMFHIEAVIDCSGQSDATAKEKAWRAALMTRDMDFQLAQDNGQPSSHSIFVKDTMSGTRAINFKFLESAGGEFVNRRTIKFDVIATYKVKNTEAAIVAWHESIVITGNGGPDRQWRFPLNAPGVREEVSPGSLVTAVQSGMAIGHMVRPNKPAPLYPDYIVNPADVYGTDTPEWLGRAFINYPVKWSYTFQRGDGPLVGGVPSLPPGV